jgi:hypothetical protein
MTSSIFEEPQALGPGARIVQVGARRGGLFHVCKVPAPPPPPNRPARPTPNPHENPHQHHRPPTRGCRPRATRPCAPSRRDACGSAARTRCTSRRCPRRARSPTRACAAWRRGVRRRARAGWRSRAWWSSLLTTRCARASRTAGARRWTPSTRSCCGASERARLSVCGGCGNGTWVGGSAASKPVARRRRRIRPRPTMDHTPPQARHDGTTCLPPCAGVRGPTLSAGLRPWAAACHRHCGQECAPPPPAPQRGRAMMRTLGPATPHRPDPCRRRSISWPPARSRTRPACCPPFRIKLNPNAHLEPYLFCHSVSPLVTPWRARDKNALQTSKNS